MSRSKPSQAWSANLAAFLLLLSAGLAWALDADEPSIRPDAKTPYFHLWSNRSVGDHGEVVLDVSATGATCGVQWRYDHAELEILRNRFGDAQFVRLPEPGCLSCDPIVLRWMHEPTGYLDVNVNVFRRAVVVPCDGGP
ncbi:MAG: hypothetical protein R3E86_13570 [Pseudomonadales bacterium]